MIAWYCQQRSQNLRRLYLAMPKPIGGEVLRAVLAPVDFSPVGRQAGRSRSTTTIRP